MESVLGDKNQRFFLAAVGELHDRLTDCHNLSGLCSRLGNDAVCHCDEIGITDLLARQFERACRTGSPSFRFAFGRRFAVIIGGGGEAPGF